MRIGNDPPQTITNATVLTPDEQALIDLVRLLRASGPINSVMLTIEDTGIIYRVCKPPVRVRRRGANIS